MQVAEADGSIAELALESVSEQEKDSVEMQQSLFGSTNADRTQWDPHYHSKPHHPQIAMATDAEQVWTKNMSKAEVQEI